MIQNEVTEIKKIMTKNDCCIHGLAGCYVDANKEMHILEQGKFCFAGGRTAQIF